MSQMGKQLHPGKCTIDSKGGETTLSHFVMRSLRAPSLLFIAAIVGGFLLTSCAVSDSGSTQKYPSNRITIIAPYPAGSSPDLAARAVASGFEKKFDSEIIVENVPGGAAIPGTTRVANSEPDGYTLGLLTTGSQVIAPLVSEASYTFKDFTYIGTVAQRPSVFVVPGDSPYDTIEQFFEAAKRILVS